MIEKTTKKYNSAFGNSVSVTLAERRMSQSDLAKSMNLTAGYVNNVIVGRKNPSARWVDLVADTLNATPAERQSLHIAAAKDHGFKLDLTLPGDSE